MDSKHYTVEVENDQYRVLRVRYGRNEKSAMHGHPAGLLICLTDARVRFTFPDGRSEERALQAGEVMQLDAEEHLPENLGDPFEVILIEMKNT